MPRIPTAPEPHGDTEWDKLDEAGQEEPPPGHDVTTGETSVFLGISTDLEHSMYAATPVCRHLGHWPGAKTELG